LLLAFSFLLSKVADDFSKGVMAEFNPFSKVQGTPILRKTVVQDLEKSQLFLEAISPVS
jgi:hypothetical protein